MRVLLLALLALAVPSTPRVSPESNSTAPTAIRSRSLPGPTYVAGELLVGLRSEAGSKRSTRAADLARDLDLDLVEAPTLDRVGAVKMRTRGFEDEDAALARLSVLPDVEYVERNALYYAASVPTDPMYQGVNNVPTDLQRWCFHGEGENRVLNAEAAWELTKGDPKVVIAVIDSGTDLDNPELTNLWVNKREQPGNAVDDDRNGYIDDVNGFDFFNHRGDVNPEIGDGVDNNGDGRADETTSHGTIVASIIGAAQDNGIGMAGAAPECPIMTIKVLGDERGVAADELVKSINYAVDNGAKVINMSLVSYVDSKTVRRATYQAFTKNVVLVAAAGNANAGYLQYPATYATVVGVGGSDSGFDGGVRHGLTEGRWPRSQFGPSVDVVAPAVVLASTVVSTGRNLEEPSLPVGSTNYEIVSGTSFAAPLVAALAGLAISYDTELHGSRTLSNDDIQALLKRAALPLSDDYDDVPDAGPQWSGSGRIDFAVALAKIPGASAPNPIIANATFSKGLLRISGDGFSRESTIEVNGTLLTQLASFSFANATLDVKGGRNSLKLRRDALNSIVIIERGVRSPVYQLPL
jgi:subtilisin family serine protease